MNSTSLNISTIETKFKPKKLELIQVFRGLAASAVLLCHCDMILEEMFSQRLLGNIFSFGGAGVDFFFVLSGFIIFYIHAKDIEQPTKAKAFAIKRLIRVYPLYWLVLGLKMVSSWVSGYDPALKTRTAIEVIKAITLFPQDKTLIASGFLGVSWTLSFEVFFYFVFGLAIVFPRKIILPIVGLWLSISLANLIGILPLDPNSLLYSFWFSPLNLEFALGCLAAYLLRRYQFSHGLFILSFGLFLVSVSIALDIYTSTRNLPSLTKHLSVLFYGIPCWVLIMGSVTLESEKTIHIAPVFSAVGNASYSIYLMHGFFISNLAKLIPKYSPTILNNSILFNLTGVLCSVISMLLCYGVYCYIEQPMLLFCRRKFANS